MRLDHLLSKEEVRVGLLLICQGVNLLSKCERHDDSNIICSLQIELRSNSGTKRKPLSAELVLNEVKKVFFWWRCAYGTHPFSSRTRWLRPKRPMILYWRRYGKAGGCRIYGGLAQLGEHLPCKQGVESSNLLVSITGAYSSAG